MLDIRTNPPKTLAQLASERLAARRQRIGAAPEVALTTESLLTSEDGFGLETATPAQRAVCRIIDGRPLTELADHPDVALLVGGTEALAQLPDGAPKELCLLSAIRCAKTMLALAAGLRMSQTVDLGGLKHGEIPLVPIVSLKLSIANTGYRMLLGTIRASKVLAGLLVGDPTAEAIMVRHPSGVPVEIRCVAGARAGAGLISRWIAGIVFDEAPRMVSAEDGVVNLDDARSAVLGRLLPGAQALYIGSPWAPFGPVYEMVQEHWQRPSPKMVVLRGTGPMLNPTWWTPERCQDLLERDPIAYRTDVEGQFATPEAAMFDPDVLDAATRTAPLELKPCPRHKYVAAMDPATRRNAWTLVIASCTGVEDGVKRHAVALAREWVPRIAGTLEAGEVLDEIAAVCRRYGIRVVYTDQWAIDPLRSLATRAGISLSEHTVTEADKVQLFGRIRLQLESRELELPPVPQLAEDLRKVKKRVTQSGVTIVLPKTSNGRHCDFAAAAALAMAHVYAEPTDPEPEPGSPEWERQREQAEFDQLMEKNRRRYEPPKRW
jgi:hypothetical protein